MHRTEPFSHVVLAQFRFGLIGLLVLNFNFTIYLLYKIINSGRRHSIFHLSPAAPDDKSPGECVALLLDTRYKLSILLPVLVAGPQRKTAPGNLHIYYLISFLAIFTIWTGLNSHY